MNEIVSGQATRDDRIAAFIIANFLFGDAAKKPLGEQSLIESGIVDSTGILELIEFLESEFRISVREDETVPQNLDSLMALGRFVERKLTETP